MTLWHHDTMTMTPWHLKKERWKYKPGFSEQSGQGRNCFWRHFLFSCAAVQLIYFVNFSLMLCLHDNASLACYSFGQPLHFKLQLNRTFHQMCPNSHHWRICQKIIMNVVWHSVWCPHPDVAFPAVAGVHWCTLIYSPLTTDTGFFCLSTNFNGQCLQFITAGHFEKTCLIWKRRPHIWNREAQRFPLYIVYISPQAGRRLPALA